MMPFYATVWLFAISVIHNTIASNNIVTLQTSLGDVIGIVLGDYVGFGGIPYTEHPPIGNYRFKEATMKMSNYPNNTFNATSYGPSCIQMEMAPFSSFGATSEDCLFLNIFTPNIDENGTISDELLPVMFWIHGGGFAIGSGSGVAPNAMMKKKSNVVSVSINYRLGALGFLAAESIYNETNGKTNGGMNGINDQIVALKWVQTYIDEYGGDPDKVTIFGESAGGFSVCYLSLIPEAVGLFNQIIIQSGHCFKPYAYQQPAVTGIAMSVASLATVGLTDNLQELRAANASILATLQPVVSIDGYLLKKPTHDMLLENNYTLNSNKVIIGSTSMDSLILWPFDASLLGVFPAPTTESQFDGYLKQYISSENDRELIKNKYYPITDFPVSSYTGFDGKTSTFNEQTMRWTIMSADVCFKCGGVFYAEKLNENNPNVDVYVYNFIGSESPNYIVHGAELQYLFFSGNLTPSDYGQMAFWNIKNFDESYANLMQDIWNNFGIYGVPNSSMTNIQWIPYSNATNKTGLFFGKTDSAGMMNNGYIHNVENFGSKGYRNGACNFWIYNMGWDVISNLCTGIYSLQPTKAPTMSPSIDPTEVSDSSIQWKVSVIFIMVIFTQLIK